jgi:hypothetical protein
VAEEPGLTAFICTTCGTQYAPSTDPPEGCAICLDERQYVRAEGQRWTTLAEIAAEHGGRVEALEPGLIGLGLVPAFAIGQRALLVDRLLWDCVPLGGDELVKAVESGGGVETIAISHPHYYTTMVEWANRFDARILLHEADRQWVMRPSPSIDFWSGDRLHLADDLELIRLGGHFAGGTACLWSAGAGGEGALLAGDIIQVVADRDWVSFMWSYPNLIPLPPQEIARIRAVVESLRFGRLYGAWWDRVVESDARAKVLRSADRYLDAVTKGR